MDNSQHRQILRALRPHGADRHDPDAQPSLAAAQADPLLGQWLEREQAFDRAFAERIQAAPTPAELRASIVAAVERSTSARATPKRRRVVAIPLTTVLAALAAAASLALLAVLVWPRQTRPVPLEDILASAVAIAPEDADADALVGQPLSHVRAWLSEHKAPAPGKVPAALADLPTEGAGIIVIEGITTSVVTFDARGFGRDDAGRAVDRRLALFTLPRRSCSEAGIPREPQIREQSGRAVAIWRDATSIHVLSVDGTAADLQRFLGGKPELVLHRPMTRAGLSSGAS